MRVGFLAENIGAFPEGMPLTASALMKFSGHNLGNFVFWRSAAEMFEGELILIPFKAAAEDFAQRLDCLLIPAANWLNARQDFGWLADFIEALDLPIVLLGLGVQTTQESDMPQLQPGTVRFLEVAQRRTPFIGVRGEYTAKVCRHYGIQNIEVMGCPSLLLNPGRKLGQQIEQNWNQAAVRVIHHANSTKPQIRAVERMIFARMRQSPYHSYAVQAPMEWLRVYLAEDRPGVQEQIKALHAFFDPESREQDFLDLLRTRTQVPHSIPAWMHLLRMCSHTINTRIHGTVIALMAGVPSLCITHDTRTRELSQTLCVPAVEASAVKSVSPSALFEQVRFDGVAFDENRSRIARMNAELLQQAGLQISPKLKAWL